ncbi:type IX secretion system membrane protein PorP/SprF [Pseudoflavitalea sp. X16]|uniref:PorP/SprF family type IX secretion system membrane protein n=1 Tax=Paraflavitalea devenefica TaxID=2716334 RepID=UPI0014223BDD|nr:type IX secretion system membrane protein PorP/SprF [Paraflavitalea devenefica]NII27887.1 type IX secretion system membrane protein PorP/SprF [Paraflavitalea devenefica]
MRKIVFVLLALSLYKPVSAQQKPHYTQYILNQYIINPALTGIENYTDIKISHRHQWAGIQDAPVTTYLTLHTPIGKDDYRTSATSFAVPGENPRGQAYWENYTAAEPHHGVGLQVINDRTGPLNHFSAYATYAYHIGISPRTSLAAGFGAGISNISLNTDKLQFQVPVDPAVYNSGVINQLRPDFMAGLYLYSADYFIGLSAQQIIPQKVVFADNAVKKEDGRIVPHIFATAGYRFLVGEDFNFIPSVLVKYINPLPPQVDINAKLQYRDLLWIGASYRTEDGYAGMVGLNISNTLNVGYAYDHTISGLNSFTKGTHEIMVGFVLGNKFYDGCPKNVW